jgi:ribosomal subunit interface protein
MKLPLQFTTRNVSISEVVKDDIREKAVKQDLFSDHIMGLRVMVEAPHRHHRQGIRYLVRINITTPNTEIVIKRQPHEDIYVAVRDAFDAARRKLEDYERRIRGTVKVHETMPHAHVSKLFPDKEYGFLETPDGHEVYFHRNSVLNEAFNRMAVGTEVRFVEESGEKGPQASTVMIVGKPRVRLHEPDDKEMTTGGHTNKTY